MANLINRLMLEQFTKELKGLKSYYFVSLQGMTVEEVNHLRAGLSEFNLKLQVVKNRIAKKSFEANGIQGVDALIQGATAVAFGPDEGAIYAAKVIQKHLKTSPALKIKGAYMEGSVLNAEQARGLADVPSREELFSMILGAVNSLMAAPAALTNQVLAQPVYAANAYVKKLEGAS